MNRATLRAMLRKNEGVRLFPYTDETGHLTIGVGRNLSDDGISSDEADMLLDRDINRVLAQLTARVPCFASLPEGPQHALADLAFNVGTEGVLRFTHLLAALEARDFEKAAEELLASRWAREVGARATEDAALMANGGPC